MPPRTRACATWEPSVIAPRRTVARARAGLMSWLFAEPYGSARLPDRSALGLDARHEVVPGPDERRGAFVLEARGQGADVHARLGEAGQDRLAVASVRGKRRSGFAVVGERLERALGHGVDREGCCESIDIERVGGFGILGAGAGPQEPLGTCAGVG